MSLQMLLLTSMLCFVAHSEAKWKLQDNVYVIDSQWIPDSSPEEVHLQCNVSGKHNTSVYWKKDNNNVGIHNASWTIKVKEPQDAGNFTCWSSATNELLSYTTLYVAKINEGGILYQILERDGSGNSKFKCTANNYSGNFTCSWMIDSQSRNRNLKFAVQSLNINKNSGRVTCEEPRKDSAVPGRYLVSCKKEKHCLSTEEYQQTEIGLDVFDENVYENDSLSFLLKDILKPDVTECETARYGNRYQVTWNPPSTWSIPVSYFSLTYQIKTVNGATAKICEVDTPMENGDCTSCSIRTRAGDHYIRSRDRYSENSAWSEWSKPCSKKNSQKNGQDHHTHDDTQIKIVPCNCQKNWS